MLRRAYMCMYIPGIPYDILSATCCCASLLYIVFAPPDSPDTVYQSTGRRRRRSPFSFNFLLNNGGHMAQRKTCSTCTWGRTTTPTTTTTTSIDAADAASRWRQRNVWHPGTKYFACKEREAHIV